MMALKKIGLTAAIAAVMALSGGLANEARASTITEINLDRTVSPVSWQTSWAQTVNSGGAENLAADGTWSFDSRNLDTWFFTLTLENKADSGARITSWGFDTTPTASNFSITAPTDWASGSGQGVMSVDHCSYSGSNCVGGQGGGLLAGNSLEFKFSFDSSEDFVSLDNFKTRWQSVGGDDEASIVISAIPLPAAGWLLLTAVGGMGLAARRRRNKAA